MTSIGRRIPVDSFGGKIIAIMGMTRIPVPAIPFLENPMQNVQKTANVQNRTGLFRFENVGMAN
jgi:hypothetical protein